MITTGTKVQAHTGSTKFGTYELVTGRVVDIEIRNHSDYAVRIAVIKGDNGKTYREAFSRMNEIEETEADMNESEINPTDVYESRSKETGRRRYVVGTELIRRIEEAKRYGLIIEFKLNPEGRQMVIISNGKGSSYGTYYKS